MNNRPDNLREANRFQNNGNVDWGPLRGVSFVGRKWQAKISINNQARYLGSFDTSDEAVAAYQAAAEAHFGEFAFHLRKVA